MAAPRAAARIRPDGAPKRLRHIYRFDRCRTGLVRTRARLCGRLRLTILPSLQFLKGRPGHMQQTLLTGIRECRAPERVPTSDDRMPPVRGSSSRRHAVDLFHSPPPGRTAVLRRSVTLCQRRSGAPVAGHCGSLFGTTGLARRDVAPPELGGSDQDSASRDASAAPAVGR